MNPNWWRAGFAIAALAIVIKALFPMVNMAMVFGYLAMFYLAGIVAAEMRLTTTSLGWLKRGAIGLVVFVALWFVVGGFVGVYPIDFFNAIVSGRGFWNLFLGKGGGDSHIVLWGVIFILLFGAVAMSTTRSQGNLGRNILIAGIVVLSLWILVPRWMATWAGTWGRIDNTLATKRVSGVAKDVGKGAVDTVKGAISSVLPARSAASPSAATTTSAPAPTRRGGLTPTLYQFGPDGCLERNFGYQTRWYPKEGAMRVFRPDGSDYVDSPGVDTPITNFGPGRWRFCRENLGATGVEIWE